MKYIVCYDISEEKIRARVAKYLEGIAIRIQMSVFALDTDERKLKDIKAQLRILTRQARAPRILILPLCSACAKKLWQIGKMIEETTDCLIL